MDVRDHNARKATGDERDSVSGSHSAESSGQEARQAGDCEQLNSLNLAAVNSTASNTFHPGEALNIENREPPANMAMSHSIDYYYPPVIWFPVLVHCNRVSWLSASFGLPALYLLLCD